MGLAHLGFVRADTPALLYACCSLAGAAYGAMWSLLPAIVGDIFPPSRFATFYNLFALAASSASLLLSTLLATKVYAAHAHAATPGVAAECYGGACYLVTHFSVAGLCAAGVLCATALGVRNRHVYRHALGRL
eukprot:scaffold253305_cov27-Tisochrysis_lutea.AAC.2